eukprot:TRINITY_DN6689_c0_g1_i1.p1 TRINITY_DN6689_c0_g1~~TRINITY_DN6689_c0_g1_i1.p1  ORF type:complete len:291 (+),score=69.35 TRINITY_DN6689_c0_g1_i1:60-932(+)
MEEIRKRPPLPFFTSIKDEPLPELDKTHVIVKTKDGVECVEIDDTKYELRNHEGSTVVLDSDQDTFYSITTEEGIPMVMTTQAGKDFYFKKVDEETENSREWFGIHYVSTEEDFVQNDVTVPDDLVQYVPVNTARPRVDIVEAAFSPTIYDIIPDYNLYLGSQDAAANFDGLKEKSITHILNVATGIPNKFPHEFQYLDVPFYDTDTEDISTGFEKCFDFIDAARDDGGVLVHCNQGVSRSTTIVLAYMMSRRGLTYDESYNIAKSVKSDICPNPGFVETLKQFEKELNQ